LADYFFGSSLRSVSIPVPAVGWLPTIALRSCYGTTVNKILLEEPAYEAVKVPVLLLRTVPVEIVNAPVLEPAGTVTDRASTSPLICELIFTLMEAVAGAESVTVQFAVEFEASVVGVHCKAATTSVDDRVKFTVLEVPLKEAVKVPFWLVLNELGLTVKIPVKDPACTVTEAGTANPDSPLLLSVTVALSCSTLFKVTVHVPAELGPSVVGVHCSDEIAGVAARFKLMLCEEPL